MTITCNPAPDEIEEAVILYVPVEEDFGGPWVGYLNCKTDEHFSLECAKAPALDACVRTVLQAVPGSHERFRIRWPGEKRAEDISREDLLGLVDE